MWKLHAYRKYQWYRGGAHVIRERLGVLQKKNSCALFSHSDSPASKLQAETIRKCQSNLPVIGIHHNYYWDPSGWNVRSNYLFMAWTVSVCNGQGAYVKSGLMYRCTLSLSLPFASTELLWLDSSWLYFIISDVWESSTFTLSAWRQILERDWWM